MNAFRTERVLARTFFGRFFESDVMPAVPQAQLAHRSVGRDAPILQNQDVSRDLLDDLEHVRTVEHHPAFSGQRTNQAPQHQRRGDIESGVRLVQHEDLRIVHQCGGNQDFLPHAF